VAGVEPPLGSFNQTRRSELASEAAPRQITWRRRSLRASALRRTRRETWPRPEADRNPTDLVDKGEGEGGRRGGDRGRVGRPAHVQGQNGLRGGRAGEPNARALAAVRNPAPVEPKLPATKRLDGQKGLRPSSWPGAGRVVLGKPCGPRPGLGLHLSSQAAPLRRLL
jgi:hypothetical protein